MIPCVQKTVMHSVIFNKTKSQLILLDVLEPSEKAVTVMLSRSPIVKKTFIVDNETALTCFSMTFRYSKKMPRYHRE